MLTMDKRIGEGTVKGKEAGVPVWMDLRKKHFGVNKEKFLRWTVSRWQ